VSLAPPRTREDLLQALATEPWRFHMYAAMRHLEAYRPDKPRIGRSQRYKDDTVRLGQEPSMAFAASTLASFTRAERNDDEPGRDHLANFFFGVFGANGPLPLHLTEYARQREQNFHDATFRAFADIFHHRMTQLFYRAWADAQPTAQADRPGDDRFALYTGAVMGIALDGLRGRDALQDTARFHWAGLFAMPTRPAEGLERILSGHLQMPVRIETCVGHWIELPEPMQSRLGRMDCRIGTATLGERVFDVAGKFRIVFGPVGRKDFERLLPGSRTLDRIVAIVRSWVGDTMWWDIQAVVRRDEVPQTRLNATSGLGYTTWVWSGEAKRDATEYRLDPVRLAG
jgi:type VI secretion system protein ImpH